MRYVTVGVVFFICAIIQTNIIGYIDVLNIKPNLFIVLIASFALLNGAFEGAVIGLIAGFIQDIILGNSVGGYTLLGMYLGIAVGALNKRFVKDNLFVAIPFVFLATIVYEAVFYFFATFLFGQTDIIYAISKIIFPEALYNAIAAILFFPIVKLINKPYKEHAKFSNKY